MSNNIYSTWTSSPKNKKTSIIIPDGCRDLIMVKTEGKKAQWFVSPLFDQSKFLQVEKNSNFIGFRMKPGTYIEERKLLKTIETNNIQADNIQDLIDNFTNREQSVEEALKCLSSSGTNSVKHASLKLGVNIRTLQRLIYKNTERAPSYWFQLARIRKAARNLTTPAPLVDIADIYGFSDQAHMNREFKRWFNLNPTQVIKSPDIMSQLNHSGYG